MANSGFVRGVPTDIDVRRLLDHFGALEVGQHISYDEVDQVLGLARSAHRWKAITTAWRKRLLAEQRLIIGCDPGVGFIVLDDAEKLDLSSSKLRSGLRSCRRAVKVAAHVDVSALTSEQQTRLDHNNRVATALIMTAATEAKRFQPTFPARQLGSK